MTITKNWHNYGDKTKFWDNGGILIRKAADTDNSRLIPNLPKIYEVFELTKDGKGQKFAYNGLVEAHKNETEADVVKRLQKNWTQSCMYYTTYCNATNDFRLTDRQLNKWLYMLNYDEGVLSDSEYASSLFNDCKCTKIKVFHDNTTGRRTERYMLDASDKLIYELIERANEDYGLYSYYNTTNVFAFQKHLECVSPSIDIYKDLDEKLRVLMNVAIYSNDGKCLLNRPVNTNGNEATLLYEMAKTFLERCNKQKGTNYTIRGLLSESSEKKQEPSRKASKHDYNYDR